MAESFATSAKACLLKIECLLEVSGVKMTVNVRITPLYLIVRKT